MRWYPSPSRRMGAAGLLLCALLFLAGCGARAVPDPAIPEAVDATSGPSTVAGMPTSGIRTATFALG
jgi:hypothetical protein